MIEATAAINASQVGGVQLRPAAATDLKAAPAMSFTEALKSTAMQQVQTVQQSEQASMAAMHGQASLQEVVQATVKAELAVETALAIRNKMIESYQEIMRMPV
ncbi:flagellar hook-basal body complex protein FliE [Parvularcula lutaonensis]|uniref:Flagellar hook-basal body complex protein FliE n=1 Tax=Parvularcula lutaonensis TaxID=491923 RepID=A0ABV7MDP8_9PROT|nr:flagellar hook-basal body complex protein FliE [Parvularcula lutaonensis]GGY50849.1 hypothetical protein GCM10007148_19580 [Parvularcula lutaonensis]